METTNETTATNQPGTLKDASDLTPMHSQTDDTERSADATPAKANFDSAARRVATKEQGKRKAGESGKRTNGATVNMPAVSRIEGKQQCRVVATDAKGRILKVGRAEVSTPVRNSEPHLASAILTNQKRVWFGKNGTAPDTFKATVEKTAGVKFVLQWLADGKWLDHEKAKA